MLGTSVLAVLVTGVALLALAAWLWVAGLPRRPDQLRRHLLAAAGGLLLVVALSIGRAAEPPLQVSFMWIIDSSNNRPLNLPIEYIEYVLDLRDTAVETRSACSGWPH